eukprot:3843370-Amphidinium_carterae.1
MCARVCLPHPQESHRSPHAPLSGSDIGGLPAKPAAARRTGRKCALSHHPQNAPESGTIAGPTSKERQGNGCDGPRSVHVESSEMHASLVDTKQL